MHEPQTGSARIHFRCSHCGQRVRARPEHAGLRMACPHCQQHDRVPTVSTENGEIEDVVAVTVDDDVTKTAQPPGEESRATKKSVKPPPMPVVAVEVALCQSCGAELPQDGAKCSQCGFDPSARMLARQAHEKKKHKKKKKRKGSGMRFLRSLTERFGDTNASSMVRGGIIVAALVGVALFVGNMLYQRSSGGFLSTMLFETISQMSPEREILTMFGAPRERIRITAVNIGDRFLSLSDPEDLEALKAARVDPTQYRESNATMVAHIEAKLYTIAMIVRPEVDYLLFYGNQNAAMFVLMTANTKSGMNPEQCSMAAYIQARGDGSYEAWCNGMAPIKNVRGDVTGYGWQDIYEPNQIIRPDEPTANLTLDPEACWKLLQKGKVRTFRF